MPKLSDFCFQNSSCLKINLHTRLKKSYPTSWLILLVGLTGLVQTTTAAESTNIEEVLITGSRIQGVPPVGAKVTTIDRNSIETTGVVTLDRMIRELPQTFDLGFSENSRGQSGGNGNATYSNSVNLRGLGPFSTLIIMDGHRMTTNGRAIDPSVLPTLGVERVEVIADGASAIYGSDAVAGVVNLIPRRNLDGVEIFARYASTPDSDYNEWNGGIALGKVFDSGQIMLAWDHAYRSNLSGDDRDFFASDQRPYGGPDYRIDACSPGTLKYAGQTYALPSQLTPENMNSLVAGTSNRCDSNQGQDLFPEQEYDSVLSTANFEINQNLELVFDGYYSKRKFVRMPNMATNTFRVPESNAFFLAPDFYVPGSGGYQIAYNFSNDTDLDMLKGYQENWQLTPGIKVELPGDWQFEAKYGFGETEDRADAGTGLDVRASLVEALASSDPATAFDPYGLGRTSQATLDSIFDFLTTFPINSKLATYQAGVSGALFEMPGGEAKLAVGYEGQDFTMTLNTHLPAEASYDRKVDSTYAELLLPIVGSGNSITGVQELQLTMAYRYDDYSDVGSTSNPKYGVNWRLNDSLKFRATYGTSFRAPTFPEIYGNNSRLYIQAYTNPDSNGPAQISGFAYGSGPNLNLGPEKATTWTLGSDIEITDDLTLGLTYFDIAYKDTIAGLLSNLSVLTLVDEYEGTDIILFGQQAYERITGLIGEGKPIQQMAGTSDACISGPNPQACIFIDGRSHNLGRSQMKGVDIDLGFNHDLTSLGSLTYQLNATYLTDYKVAFTPGGDLVSKLNDIYNPSKFKSRASVTWDYGSWSTRLQGSYLNSYSNTLTAPEQKVDAYILYDLALTWRPSSDFISTRAQDLALTLEVRNLLDEDPPYVNVAPSSNGSGGYDATSSNPIGRLLSLAVRVKF